MLDGNLTFRQRLLELACEYEKLQEKCDKLASTTEELRARLVSSSEVDLRCCSQAAEILELKAKLAAQSHEAACREALDSGGSGTLRGRASALSQEAARWSTLSKEARDLGAKAEVASDVDGARPPSAEPARHSEEERLASPLGEADFSFEAGKQSDAEKEPGDEKGRSAESSPSKGRAKKSKASKGKKASKGRKADHGDDSSAGEAAKNKSKSSGKAAKGAVATDDDSDSDKSDHRGTSKSSADSQSEKGNSDDEGEASKSSSSSSSSSSSDGDESKDKESKDKAEKEKAVGSSRHRHKKVRKRHRDRDGSRKHGRKHQGGKRRRHRRKHRHRSRSNHKVRGNSGDRSECSQSARGRGGRCESSSRRASRSRSRRGRPSPRRCESHGPFGSGDHRLDLDRFISKNQLEARVAHALRSMSEPDQKKVMGTDGGENSYVLIDRVNNPNAVVMSRIRRLEQR